MEKTLTVDINKCCGCRICEQFCAYNHGKSISEDNTRIRVVKDHKAFTNTPIVCQQCADPTCIKVCPTKALSQNANTGAVLVDQGLCVGCRICVKSCPYGGIHYVQTTKKVVICDLCNGEPKCVVNCPMQAIEYLDTNVAEDKYRENVARKIGGSNHE